MDLNQSAVLMGYGLMEKRTTSCTDSFVKIEDDIKKEMGFSEDDHKPIVHIAVKEESPEEDPLALSPKNECKFLLEEEAEYCSVKTEVVHKAISQRKSAQAGELAKSQIMTISTDSQASHLLNNVVLNKTTEEDSYTSQCTCSGLCKCQHESKHSNLLSDIKYHNYCFSCNEAFFGKFSLKAHCRQHIVKMSCPNCSKEFSNISNLKIHCRVHTGEKPYQCPTCKRAFSLKHNLIRHYKLHTGEKPFQCHTCSKAFTEKSSLITHCRRQHTGEKPHQCPVCNKTFYDTCHLKRHSRQHTGEKPYRCTSCSIAFDERWRLIRHSSTHTGEKPYQCATCNKAFSRKSSLIQHCRIHTGEKPYKCPTCSRAFSGKQHLVNHSKTHTDEKPYRCPICNRPFRLMCTLKRHGKQHLNGQKPCRAYD